MILSAPTRVEQADAFIGHSRDRVVATLSQIHHAALAAGDRAALRLQHVVEPARMSVVLSPKPPSAFRPGETIAIKSFRGVLARRGDRLAREVLTALVQSGIAPISGADVQTAEALLCEPDINEAFDVEHAAAAFRDMDARIRHDAKAARGREEDAEVEGHGGRDVPGDEVPAACRGTGARPGGGAPRPRLPPSGPCDGRGAGRVDHARTAQGLVAMLRRVILFGATIELKECARIAVILQSTKWEGSPKRSVALGFRHVEAFITMAHEMERPSLALGTALQWEALLRQRGVIGEWEPYEVGTKPPEGWTINGRLWVNGLLWEHIAADWTKSKRTIKTAAVITFDLTAQPWRSPSSSA